MTPETHKRSALYMLTHDEWCSHDETDDGIPCDCHLSVIVSLRKRLEAAEKWRRVAAMLRSVVKSGEPWTATLETEWVAALAGEKK